MIYDKEILDSLINEYVSITFYDDEKTYNGWLVKDKYKKNKYMLLINDGHYHTIFTRSNIKSIKFVSNDYIIPKNKKEIKWDAI